LDLDWFRGVAAGFLLKGPSHAEIDDTMRKILHFCVLLTTDRGGASAVAMAQRGRIEPQTRAPRLLSAVAL
jgi:hypothetical protein